MYSTVNVCDRAGDPWSLPSEVRLSGMGTHTVVRTVPGFSHATRPFNVDVARSLVISIDCNIHVQSFILSSLKYGYEDC